MSDTPTETEARLARSVVGQGRTSLVATAIREAQDAWPTRLGVSMPMTDPMEAAARASCCPHGCIYKLSKDCVAGEKEKVGFKARKIVSAYLTAALNDPATVERCCDAVHVEGDKPMFSNRSIVQAVIKALADE